MGKGFAIAAFVVVGLLAAGGGYWLGTHRGVAPATLDRQAAPAKGPSASNAPQAVSVEAVKVAVEPMPQTITAVGSLRSDESVTLRPESAGRISAIAFQEGQHVQKGAPLVRLDPAIPEAEVEQAKANYTLAKAKFDRAVDLAHRNYISGQAKDEAENNLRVAEAALRLAQAKLAKTEIRAPFSGIIGLRSVSVGDYVKEGADLVNLESIDPLKVDFRVPETYLRQVRPGQPVTVTLDAIPGKSYDGSVLALNPLVDAAGRAIVIRAQVRNHDTTLRPGMFARVRLITREQADAMVVPEQALVPQGSEQYVFKVVDNKAARVKVETGQRRDAKVQIVSGLQSDDVVVIAGQLKLRDGVPVTVVAAPGAATPQVTTPTEGRGALDAGAVGARPVKVEAQAARGRRS